jgi:hypothetical protein
MLFAGLLVLLLSLFPSFTEEAKVMADGYETVKNVPNSYLSLAGWFLTAFSILHLYPASFSFLNKINDRARTVIRIAVTIVIAVASIIAVLFCFIFLCRPDDKPFNYPGGRSFNQADWNRRDGDYHDRKFVVNDLMKNRLQQGMHYKKVTALSGESETYFPSKDSTNFALSYEIEALYRWVDIAPYDIIFLYITFSATDFLLIDSQ